MGFSWTGDINCPLPECIVCGEKLSNTAMAPAKLKRHFSTKHGDLANKNVDHFKRLKEEKTIQAVNFQSNFKESDKAQEASYLVAELVAKEMKAHTIAESLIIPACQAMVKTMFGDEAEKEIKKIPLSDNTISRRISDMSEDIEANVIEKLKGSQFSLQVDESTDISGKAQLLSFMVESWSSKLAYLADIFQHLNKFNTNMQGRAANVLSSTDKLHSLKQKLEIWKTHAINGNLEMFPLVAQTKCQEILPLILDHLTSLQGRIDHYFPTLSFEDYDWVRNPFLEILSKEGIFTLREEEELTDIRHDRTLKLEHRDSSLDSFWVSIENEYPTIAIKAIKILLLFSTTYLCELGFSSLTNIKSVKRERLLSVEEEMRVCLSTIRPRIKEICKSKQSQISH